MNTTTRPRPTRGEIARAVWCVRDLRAAGASRIAHLVDLDQPARPGGIRDSVCDIPAMKWQPVSDQDNDGRGECGDCALVICQAAPNTLVPIHPSHHETAPTPAPLPVPGLCLPGPALPLSRAGQAQPSAPRHDPIGCTPAPPREANTAAARAARRVAFRDVVRLAPDTTDYQPAGNDRRPPSWRRPATT